MEVKQTDEIFPLCVQYGHDKCFIDVTFDVLHKCLHQNYLLIPGGNLQQDKLFTDPLPNVVKSLRVWYDGHSIACNAESDFKLIFPPEQDIFRFASMLRHVKHTMHFALQLLVALYTKTRKESVLHIGSQSGMCRELLAEKSFRNMSFLEPNNDEVAALLTVDMNNMIMLPFVNILPFAFAYQPVVLFQKKIISAYDFENLTNPQKNKEVRFHESATVEEKKTENVSNAGLARCNLAELQKEEIFSTLVFESCSCFHMALMHAAPTLLKTPNQIILRVQRVQQHKQQLQYIAQQMEMFEFSLVCELKYHQDNLFHIWKKK